MYDNRFKYPRTFHLPWSLSLQNDDRRLPSFEGLEGEEVVVTEKYDGENTSYYRDISHARSMDSRHHVSRDWTKKHHGEIAHLIPDDWRIVIENMYATHSIKYRREGDNALPSMAMGLSVWDKETCLGWDETLMIFQELGIIPARTLYRGIWDEEVLRKLAKEQDPNLVEGYVVRTVKAIPYGKWFLPAAKYVRAKHVATDVHWMQAEVVPNELMTDEQIEDVREMCRTGRW